VTECPWKLFAMILVAISVVVLGFWLPSPLHRIIQQTAHIIRGTP
jgi:hypothetical protein